MEYSQISMDLVNLFEMLDNPSKHSEIPAYVTNISKRIKQFKEEWRPSDPRDLTELQDTVRKLREGVSQQEALISEYSLKNK